MQFLIQPLHYIHKSVHYGYLVLLSQIVTLKTHTSRPVCLGYKILPEHEQAILKTLEDREEFCNVEVVKMQLGPAQFDLASEVIRAPRLPNAR